MARIHPQFRLNGTAYTAETLLVAAQKWNSDEDRELRELAQFVTDWCSEKTYMTLQTSGSSGQPKTIVLPKTAFEASVLQTGQFFNLSAGDSALLCLPLRYVAGKMMLLRAMVLGLALDRIPPKTVLSFRNKVYDFGALIPLQAQHNLDKLEQIKTLLIGGASISPALRKKLTTHPNCVETYGMTETLTHIATRPVKLSPVPFQALPQIELETTADRCLVIKAPYITKTPIATHDVVRMHGPNSFALLGRLDWVINSGGLKIFPEQLEEKLAEVLTVPFFFAGLADDTLGEKLALLVETDTTEKNRIMQVVDNVFTTDKHHIPKEVICVPSFSYTATGKLDRKKTKVVAVGNIE